MDVHSHKNGIFIGMDPYNGYYKSLWTIGWLAPINGY